MLAGVEINVLRMPACPVPESAMVDKSEADEQGRIVKYSRTRSKY